MSNPVFLNNGDVVSIGQKWGLTDSSVFKCMEVSRRVLEIVSQSIPNYSTWTIEGYKGEVLQVGKDWQKGKLRLVVRYHIEFTPDSPTPFK